VPRGQSNGSPQPHSLISKQEPLLFLPSSFAIVLARLSELRSRPTACTVINTNVGMIREA
jgi:hypothetical protein